jgi:hypothetical protein
MGKYPRKAGVENRRKEFNPPKDYGRLLAYRDNFTNAFSLSQKGAARKQEGLICVWGRAHDKVRFISDGG